MIKSISYKKKTILCYKKNLKMYTCLFSREKLNPIDRGCIGFFYNSWDPLLVEGEGKKGSYIY
jgi:hypothetical protein